MGEERGGVGNTVDVADELVPCTGGSVLPTEVAKVGGRTVEIVVSFSAEVWKRGIGGACVCSAAVTLVVEEAGSGPTVEAATGGPL